ncbi:peptidase inhibitor family I36 protein [Embleya sp. NBC_00896]|uniref:peptidase inhibitor family I36 protein n=1 Tax=Embleya sp. NBC_00896 TaxID=2975961 RepID=UPI00386BEA89|nr:peptidase inhibitor family I36 protein [Embleya sp. NBC_00896]
MRVSIAVGVLALFGTALSALPAHGEEALRDCPADRLCLFDGKGRSKAYAVTDDARTYEAAWDDKTLSVRNNTPYWACMYADPEYGGALETVKPGNTDAYAGGGFARKASSHKLVSSRAQCFTGYERCPEARLCIFKEPRGRGPMFVADADRIPAYAPSWANGVHSAVNRTALHACFYRAERYTGTWPNPEGPRPYGAFVVLSGADATIPDPFAATFRSHELVAGTKECQA